MAHRLRTTTSFPLLMLLRVNVPRIIMVKTKNRIVYRDDFQLNGPADVQPCRANPRIRRALATIRLFATACFFKRLERITCLRTHAERKNNNKKCRKGGHLQLSLSKYTRGHKAIYASPQVVQDRPIPRSICLELARFRSDNLVPHPEQDMVSVLDGGARE
jgi:hypothetical protein